MVLSNGPARKRGLAIATVTAVLAAVIVSLGAQAAFAGGGGDDSPHKAFVCKYVGTPGVNERLQSVIDVDIHAVGDPTVGSYFNDAQGRSFVLALDTGQTAPTTADCPSPAPDHVTPAAPIYTPGTCLAVGTVVATDTAQYTWASSGTTAATYETASAVGNVVLDETVFGPYDLSKLSGDACPTPPPATTYDAVLWQTHTYNQKYSQDKISVTNEDSITLPTIPTTCGTSWQGDVYIHGDAENAWLTGTTSLAGPDGAQDGSYLAPGGYGVAYVYVVNPPCPPAPITCTVTGAPYTESGDHPPVQTAEGWDFRSFHDGHATSVVIPISGNAQGITSLSFTDKNIVGYGMFSRLIFDLSADGGPSYASYSVSPGNTIDQSSVAGVGSNSHLLGKTLAQVAAAYPHNMYHGWGFQTGSNYPGDGTSSSDGATLTGYSGDCGTMSFVPTKPADEVSYKPNTTVDCTSDSQTTITTKTVKPQVWNASATPPGYAPDTNPADWTVTDDSPGVTVALTSGQIAEDCPDNVITPTGPSYTESCHVTGASTTDAVTTGITYTDVLVGNTVTTTATAVAPFIIADGAQTVWVHTFVGSAAVSCTIKVLASTGMTGMASWIAQNQGAIAFWMIVIVLIGTLVVVGVYRRRRNSDA